MKRCEFDRIDPAITSPLANQPVASESERARDQRQRAALTPQVSKHVKQSINKNR